MLFPFSLSEKFLDDRFLNATPGLERGHKLAEHVTPGDQFVDLALNPPASFTLCSTGRRQHIATQSSSPGTPRDSKQSNTLAKPKAPDRKMMALPHSATVAFSGPQVSRPSSDTFASSSIFSEVL